jgi:hypothetical protein
MAARLLAAQGAFSRLVIATLLISCWTGAASARSWTPQTVPGPLKSWVPWALDGEAACPFLHARKRYLCIWPTHLELSLTQKGGRFRQSFDVYAERLVALPGDTKRWPQQVLRDGKAAPLVDRHGVPHVQLGAGRHTIGGRFEWDRPPLTLSVPRATGLISLKLHGEVVPFPRRDAAGALLLRSRRPDVDKRQRLELRVGRRVVDEIPLQVETHIALDVAGASREVLLAKALLDGFTALTLQSKLPARLERGGALRVQLRPGRWTIVVRSRQRKKSDTVALPKLPAQARWPRHEVWAFEPRPALRQVEPTGLQAIDPQRTTLPMAWRSLSCFRVVPGQALRLKQRRRGDAGTRRDELQLERTLWLDFDGQGLTISDLLRGTLRASSRLEMGPETALGRVTAAGRDRFITARGRLAGVELGRGGVSARANSRYTGAVSRLPAVGWDHDVQWLSATLNVPPGWRVLHVFGADQASGTWLERWSLLDLFWVLVLTLVIIRLFGWKLGLLALGALLLTFTEPGAPRWLWFVVLGLEASRRKLGAGWRQRITTALAATAALGLALHGAVFIVGQLRQGLYPILERAHHHVVEGRQGHRSNIPQWLRLLVPPEAKALSVDLHTRGSRNAAIKVTPKAKAEEIPEWLKKRGGGRAKALGKGNALGSDAPTALAGLIGAKVGESYGIGGLPLAKRKQPRLLPTDDPNARVQTGPGLPDWRWSSVRLSFDGPVHKDERVALLLLSPPLNLALSLTRAWALGALLVLLALVARRRRRLFDPPTSGDGEGRPHKGRDELRVAETDDGEASSSSSGPGAKATTAKRALAATALGLVALLAAGASARAEVPADRLLNQLKRRLLRPARCFPRCASSARLALTAKRDSLRLRLEVDTQTLTAVPLPGQAKHWRATRVLVDGKRAVGLAERDGKLWLPLSAGRHQVLLEGPLPRRTTVQLLLPLVPHRVEAELAGWRLDGVGDNGVPESTLVLTRLAAAGPHAAGPRAAGPRAAGAREELQADALPPFLRVTRRLLLGLKWRIETTVERVGPTGSPVVVSVPLLEGESVTDDNLRVAAGGVKLQLGPQQRRARWRSVLRQRARVSLRAPRDVQWSETWQLVSSPIWHVEATGLRPIHQSISPSVIPTWRPWPGERLTLRIGRPAGKGGRTLTIDSSRLFFRPSQRATETTLMLRVRSSRAGQHVITLPPGARLKSIRRRMRPLPARQQGRRVTLPIARGEQSFTLTFIEQRGLTTRFSAPVVDLGAPSVNSTLDVQLPDKRWVLLAGGAVASPAVLLWSLLGVLALAGLLLGRLRCTPLRTHQWLLLLLGLSQVPTSWAAVVCLWLIAVGWRQHTPSLGPPIVFKLRQLGLAIGFVATSSVLLSAVYQGLLGEPLMRVVGNGSHARLLRFFVDRAEGALPQPWVISAPLWFYRLAMLAWALWLAWALIGWLRAAWAACSAGGLWRRGVS